MILLRQDQRRPKLSQLLAFKFSVDDLAADFDRLRGHVEFRDPEPVELP